MSFENFPLHGTAETGAEKGSQSEIQESIKDFNYPVNHLGDQDIFNKDVRKIDGAKKIVSSTKIKPKHLNDLKKRYIILEKALKDKASFTEIFCQGNDRERRTAVNAIYDESIKKVLAMLKTGKTELSTQNWDKHIEERLRKDKQRFPDANKESIAEGIFCFHEGFTRVLTALLSKALEDPNSITPPELADLFSYDKNFNEVEQENHQNNSATLKTAYFIEMNRKKSPPEPVVITEPEEPTPIIPIVPEPGEPKVPEEPTPVPVPVVPEKKTIYGIDISEIAKRYAYKRAEKRLNDILHAPEEGGFDTRLKGDTKWEKFKSVGKSVLNTITSPFRAPLKWGKKMKHRIAETYYREKFFEEELKKIVNDQNLMSQISKSLDPSDKTKNIAELEKIVDEYKQEVTNLVERGEKLDDPNLNAKISKLALDAITNNWDKERINQESTKLFNDAKKAGGLSNKNFAGTSGRDSEAEGLMYASNLAETIESYKESVNQQITALGITEADLQNPEKREQLLDYVKSVMKIDVQLGLKFSDLHNKRPKGSFHFLDKLVRRCQSLPYLGAVVNPATLGLVTGVGSRLALVASKPKLIALLGVTGAVATVSWLPLAVGAGIAGTAAAVRANLSKKHDRGMDQRRETLGEGAGGARTEKIRRFSYDQVLIDTLIDGGQHKYTEATYKFTGLRSAEKTRDYKGLVGIENQFATKTDLLNDNAKDEVAEMLARFLVELQRDKVDNKKHTADLFKVAREEGKEQETLTFSKVDFKIRLYNYLSKLGLIDKKILDVIDTDIRKQDPTLAGILDQSFETLVKTKMNELNLNINNQDKAFDIYRREYSLKMGAGVFAGAVGLGKAIEWLAGTDTTSIPATGPARPASMHTILDSIDANGTNVDFTGAGTYTFTAPSGSTINVFLDANGAVDPSSLPTGWTLSGSTLIHNVPGSSSSLTDVWDKFSVDHGGTTAVHYQDFLSNKTPPTGVTIFDSAPGASEIAQANLTELQMDYMVDPATGNWIIDMTRMLGKTATNADGSLGIDVQEYLQDGGKIEMLLSPERGMDPIKVAIELSGGKAQAIVPHDLAENFVSMTQQPTGEYLMNYGGGGIPDVKGLHQLALNMGENADGSENMIGLAARFEAPPMIETSPVEEVIDLNLINKEILVSEVPGEEIAAAMPIGTMTGPRNQLENERTDEGQEPSEEPGENQATDNPRENEDQGLETSEVRTETRKGMKETLLGLPVIKQIRNAFKKTLNTDNAEVEAEGDNQAPTTDPANISTNTNSEKKTFFKKALGTIATFTGINWLANKLRPKKKSVEDQIKDVRQGKTRFNKLSEEAKETLRSRGEHLITQEIPDAQGARIKALLEKEGDENQRMMVLALVDKEWSSVNRTQEYSPEAKWTFMADNWEALDETETVIWVNDKVNPEVMQRICGTTDTPVEEEGEGVDNSTTKFEEKVSKVLEGKALGTLTQVDIDQLGTEGRGTISKLPEAEESKLRSKLKASGVTEIYQQDTIFALMVRRYKQLNGEKTAPEMWQTMKTNWESSSETIARNLFSSKRGRKTLDLQLIDKICKAEAAPVGSFASLAEIPAGPLDEIPTELLKGKILKLIKIARNSESSVVAAGQKIKGYLSGEVKVGERFKITDVDTGNYLGPSTIQKDGITKNQDGSFTIQTQTSSYKLEVIS